MKRIFQKVSVAFLKAFSRIPFPIIHLISDFLYFLLYYIVRYRRRVVNTNLKNAFPEKSEKEIGQITRKFYKNLCDVSLETIKFSNMSYKELDQRQIFVGTEKLNEYFDKGKSVIVLGMHYANWEWNPSMQRLVKHKIMMIYNPIRNNPEMERFILNMRDRFGGESIPVNLSARTAMQFDKNKRPGILWLAADQTPFQTSKFWTTFLNQETPFFEGPDKIACKTNQPVFFIQFKRIARGKYRSELIELFSEPSKEKPETILMTYVEVIERIIKHTPENWLWSHRRWKHKRLEGTPLLERIDVSKHIPTNKPDMN